MGGRRPAKTSRGMPFLLWALLLLLCLSVNSFLTVISKTLILALPPSKTTNDYVLYNRLNKHINREEEKKKLKEKKKKKSNREKKCGKD